MSPLRFAPPWRRPIAWVLAGYSITLLLATHWPKVDLGGAPEGTDKAIHFVAYGLWSVLALGSGVFGHWRSAAARWRTLAAGAVFGALDEATQAIPALNRHTSLWDFLADVLGLAIGVGAAWALAAWWRRRGGPGEGAGWNPDSCC